MLRACWHFLTVPRGRTGHRFHGVARGARGGARSGIALLVVITTLMFVTVLVTEVAFSSRVRFLKATHERDDEAAYWLARSGVNMYRLILVANKQLSQNSSVQQFSELLGVNLGDALWQMVPSLNTGLLRLLFVNDGSVGDEELESFESEGLSEDQVEESRQEGRFSDKSFLDFAGDFAAEIVDEDSRINVALLGAANSETFQEVPAAVQLYGLMSGEENDQWFYERNVDRWELIGNLKDWMDQDTTRSWPQGGYEDALYNRLESPYLPKNAAFDTEAEIRLVEGWQDDVYERFGESLTIHGAGKININTASDEIMRGLLKGYVRPVPTDAFVDQIMQQLAEYVLLTEFRTGKDFVQWLEGLGLDVEPTLEKAVDTKSNVFTITSTGLVGEASRTITCVLDFTKKSEGEVVYWRVD